MPNPKYHPLLILLWLGLGMSPLAGQDSVAPNRETGQPTAQEALLGELLAKLPEAERASMIARALAAVRVGESSAEIPSGKLAREPNPNQELEPTLQSLNAGQRLLRAELERLRVESRGLQVQIQRLQSLVPPELTQTPLLPTPSVQGRAFLLPNFQRPGLKSLPGPYVNQPSVTSPACEPIEPTAPEAAAELAQLQRDLQRLNQRLRQWQDPAGNTLAEPTNEPNSAPQATRPSPLLPR